MTHQHTLEAIATLLNTHFKPVRVYGGHIGDGAADFEASSLLKLQQQIVSYHEGERTCPTLTRISVIEGDKEWLMSEEEVDTFNRSMQQRFEDEAEEARNWAAQTRTYTVGGW